MPGNEIPSRALAQVAVGGETAPAAGRLGPPRRDTFWAKQLRIWLTGSAFLLFWVGGAILSWIVIPAITLYHRRDAVLSRRSCRRVASSALRFHIAYMSACRLIDFDPRSIESQLPKIPFVLVANHPTLIDVVLLLASYPSICCVAKGRLFTSPLVGGLLRRCGHIDAGDGSVPAGAAVVLGAMDRLAAGDPVLIFPEGTRSPPRTLGVFKAGAFSIAGHANVPLIPVRISASPPGLMKGMPWYTVPGGTMRFELSVLKPVDPSRYQGDLRAMVADVRASLT